MHPLTTLGLGIACLTCLGVLLITGFTLFLYYVPDQEKAYELGSLAFRPIPEQAVKPRTTRPPSCRSRRGTAQSSR